MYRCPFCNRNFIIDVSESKIFNFSDPRSGVVRVRCGGYGLGCVNTAYIESFEVRDVVKDVVGVDEDSVEWSFVINKILLKREKYINRWLELVNSDKRRRMKETFNVATEDELIQFLKG